jgi:hypothetical protein
MGTKANAAARSGTGTAWSMAREVALAIGRISPWIACPIVLFSAPREDDSRDIGGQQNFAPTVCECGVSQVARGVDVTELRRLEQRVEDCNPHAG